MSATHKHAGLSIHKDEPVLRAHLLRDHALDCPSSDDLAELVEEHKAAHGFERRQKRPEGCQAAECFGIECLNECATSHRVERYVKRPEHMKGAMMLDGERKEWCAIHNAPWGHEKSRKGWCTYCHRQFTLTEPLGALPVHSAGGRTVQEIQGGELVKMCRGSDGQPSPYTEHEKMASKRADIDAVTNFLEDLQEHHVLFVDRLQIADEYSHLDDWGRVPITGFEWLHIREMLARHFGIDEQKISDEKDAMLRALRENR